MNLSDLTTLRVGGPVGTFLDAPLQSAVPDISGDLLVIGGGSNLVAPDAGFHGTVLRDTAREIRETGEGVLSVDSGVPWDRLVEESISRGFSGLEALSGIPGSVGAAPVQNIGAYGSEVADCLQSVKVWDRAERVFTVIGREALGLSYRNSVLKESISSGKWGPTGRWVVVSVDFKFEAGLSAPIRYRELAQTLDLGIGDRCDPAEVRRAVLDIRRSKGMVLDPTDHDTWSAGSFFTNPVVESAPEGAPAYPVAGGVKTSAAWLITNSGFERGFTLNGRAALSSKHVLAITNRGNANSKDVIELADHVRQGVNAQYGIDLVPEPLILERMF